MESSNKRKKSKKNTMDGNPKQLIVERIKNATNILVTVSRDPSVDELAAALGFTMMLNKMDKHATAVFSGALPDAISFLEPTKTFESTVDSLRDFIIALDKEKADRLRYKVEDDVVRIFITPYRTTITEADLDFSQGDFNVELIVALGVDKKEDLDTAITAHGRILHDATVVTINSNDNENTLGSIDWSDASASSLCEMLMSLSEALQSGLLDQSIATSLLTGIVAATERFSNPRTSPKVMTMAAQLMAAGANQQLIAAKLQEGHAIGPQGNTQLDGSKPLEEGSSAKVNAPEPTNQAVGEMHVEHDQPVAQPPQPEVTNDAAGDDILRHAAPVAPTLSVSDLQKDLEEATKDVQAAAGIDTPEDSNVDLPEPTLGKAKVSDWRGKIIEPPSMGGTLSATSSEAEEAKHEEERSTRNHTILSHDGADAGQQAMNAPQGGSDEPPTIDPFADTLSYEETSPVDSKPRVIEPLPQASQPIVPEVALPHEQTIAELEEQARHMSASTPSTIDDARAAVDAALGTDFTPPPLADPYAPPASVSATSLPLPPQPPMPDFSSLPPLPPLPGEPQAPINIAPVDPQFPQQPPVAPNTDPSQFKIPGQ